MAAPLGSRKLCKFSVSEVYSRSILPACPLGLTATEGKVCPCKQRVWLPNDIRVLTCTHPNDYRGERIVNEAKFVAAIQKKVEVKKNERNEKRKANERVEPMAATETAAADDKKKSAKELPVMTMDRTNAMAVYSKITNVLEFVKLVGSDIYESKMFGCANASQGRMMALAILIEGRSPIEYTRTYYMIGGKLTMRADAMLAEALALGVEHEIITRDEKEVAIKLKRSAKDYAVFQFTWAEAQNEAYVYTQKAADDPKLRRLPNGEVDVSKLKDNWGTPRRRKQMMWARCVSDAVRAFEPRAVAGFYTPEEFDVIPTDENGEVILDAEFPVATKQEPSAEAAGVVVDEPKVISEPAKQEKAAEPKPEEKKPDPVKESPKEEPKPAEKVEEKAAVTPKAETSEDVNQAIVDSIEYPEVGDSRHGPFQTSLVECYKPILKIIGDAKHKDILKSRKVDSLRELPLKEFHLIILRLEDKLLAAGKISATSHAVSRALRPAKN